MSVFVKAVNVYETNWTPTARATYDILKSDAKTRKAARKKKKTKKSSKAEGLFKQVAKTISLLTNDPRHPGLNTHEYLSLIHI